MKLFDRILGRETRDESIQLSDPYLGEFFGMQGRYGDGVNHQRASGLATAQACIGIISQALASVPLNLYRRSENGGRDRAVDHPLYAVLHDEPNPTMTAFEVREMLIASLLVSGNAYARLKSNGRGQVYELHPLNPAFVTVERLGSQRLRYRVSKPSGGVEILLQHEILHLRYRLAPDGVMGLSPIQIARETFALALAQQDTATTNAAKGNRPEGVLSFPNVIGSDGKTKALAALETKIEKGGKTGGVLALDGGAEWKAMALSSRDAEFLDSIKLSNLDICRIWGVPPTVAGILDHGTYSNVESESKALVVRCLAPMAKRIEQSMNNALLTALSRKSLFIEHDLAGLMRGDMKARYEAYRVGREWGWLSPNEIRGWENLPSIDEGDEYLSPLNMTQLGERQTSKEV